jgi:hypothetical protein
LSEIVGEQVTAIDAFDFDPRNQYVAAVDAVKEAGNGEAEFFKAELDRTRVRYFVLSLDAGHGRIVGLMALGIES